MIETITTLFNQFVESVVAPGFDFSDLIALLVTVFGIFGIIF